MLLDSVLEEWQRRTRKARDRKHFICSMMQRLGTE